MIRKWDLTILALLSGHAAGQVCESALIPMDTVELNNGLGHVCVPKNCVEGDIVTTDAGTESCFPCSQATYQGMGGSTNGRPLTNVCPANYAECQDSKCVPKSSDYYQKHFGTQWNGLATLNQISVTYYGGSTACGCWSEVAGCNDVDTIAKCVKKAGLHGIAAVPATMYGSDGTRGQGCFKNNNVCYELTNEAGLSFTVGVFDICGGYAQATPSSALTAANFATFDPVDPDSTCSDTNTIISAIGTTILAGCAYNCDLDDTADKSFCQESGGMTQVDWCAGNDHAHFDLNMDLFDQVCPGARSGIGHCMIPKAEPILCPVHAKQPFCCKSGTCDACTQIADASCSAYEESCTNCGGTSYCTPDEWYDICNADPDDIPGGSTNNPTPAPGTGTQGTPATAGGGGSVAAVTTAAAGSSKACTSTKVDKCGGAVPS